MKILLTVFKIIGIICLLFSELTTISIIAQQNTFSAPSILSSTGQTALSEGAFAVNPALIGRIDSGFVAVTFVPSRFGMNELNFSGIIAGNKLSDRISTMVGVSGFGTNSIYSELSAIAGISGKIGDGLLLGGSAEYSRITVKDFPSSSKVEVNFGGLLIISKEVTASASFTNILRGSFGVDSKIIRQTVLIGMGATLSSSLWLDADAVVSLNQYSGISLAARYDITDYLKCRLAVSSAPRSAEVAVAFHPIEQLTLIVRGHYHDVLGISQQLSLIWYW
ncbi:MAG: hypothetical protein JST20_03880 [Bacteroidetes bacterium]|nr:hypothetical protein [Bacteroidota bacterium]